MIMVHEKLPCSGDFPGRFLKVLGEIRRPFRRTVLVRHGTQAYVLASHDVVLCDQPIRIIENPVHIAVRQYDFQSLPIADLPNALRADIPAHGRNLHCTVPNLRHSLHAPRKVLFVLGIRAQCIQLCPSLHTPCPPLWSELFL